MKSVFPLLVLTVLVILFNGVPMDAKVVVLFSVPHTANVRTHTNVGRALTKMGHEAYVLIPQFMLDDKLVNVEGVKVIAYGDYLGNSEETLWGAMMADIWEEGSFSVKHMLHVFGGARSIMRQVLNDKAFLAKLKSVNPDLFVISELPPFLNMAILLYMLDVPFAYMSPFYDIGMFRVPFLPSATACQPIASGFNTDSFLGRLKNFICNMNIMIAAYITTDSSFITELAPHRPAISVTDLIRKAEIYLVEADYVMEYAKPMLPNVKFIGCTAPTMGKPLKEPFKTFVESSKNGVAVVTFGSSVLNMPEDIAKKMMSAFHQQNLKIVWRANYSSPDPKKILVATWIPQNDILAHENTKLFVSHCGANGQYEALYHGVPILCLPLFGDQPYNAERSTAKGYGLHGDLITITANELAGLMKELLSHDKYKLSIQKASKLFKLLHKLPENEAAFWIDHVMEYGGSYMRSAIQDMPLYQYLALDVLAFFGLLFTVVILFFYGLLRCCCCMCRKCCGGKEKPKKD